MYRTTNTRRRFGLLASSSLVASTLVAGLGGAALTAFSPAVALAATTANCAPNQAGTSAGSATTPTKAVEVCGDVIGGSSDVGVFYKAVPLGKFAVLLEDEAITTNGVSLTSGLAADETIQVENLPIIDAFLGSTTGNITGPVSITSAGGNVTFGSGFFGTASTVVAGANVTSGGSGVTLTTTGSGSVTANIAGNVSATGGVGLSATSGSGAINVKAQTASGSGAVTISGSGDGVDLNTLGNVTLSSLGTISSSGAAGVNIGGTTASTGTVKVDVQNVTAFGDGIDVSVANAGSATVNIHGNVASTQLFGAGVGVNVKSSGNGLLTVNSDAGTDISNDGNFDNGVTVSSQSGSVVVNLKGTVGANFGGVGGSGISAVVSGGTGSINVTESGVTNIAGAFNGVSTLNNGAGTSTVTTNGGITAAEAGVSMTGFGTLNLVVGAGNAVGGAAYGNTGDGVAMTSFGTGGINITQGTVGDQTASITSGASAGNGNGITALEASIATGDINITFDGNISSNNVGIDAQTFNTGANQTITIEAGNVSAGFGAGIFAQNAGSGDINITTIKGTNVSSTNNDGIDAFALNGGNVTVSLLDGSVSANTAGGAGSGPGFGTVTGSGPVLVSGSLVKVLGGSTDPVGVFMTAVDNGTVTLNQNSSVTNGKAPTAILGSGIVATTVNGAINLNVNANVTNFMTGNGVLAEATGGGGVTVDLFKEGTGLAGQTQNSVTINTQGGSGILAENTSSFANVTVQIITEAGAPGPLSVTVANGAKSSAGIAAENFGNTGTAVVDLSNAPAGSSVNVEGAGSNVGIEALGIDGSAGGVAPSASVTTGAGLSVTVGTLGGNGDVGVLAVTQDDADFGVSAGVTLGANNTITVGAAGKNGTGLVGVEAEVSPVFTLFNDTDAATVTGGVNDVITVTGAAGTNPLIGAEAISPFGAATVTFGDGGNISVVDANPTAGGGPDIGVLAQSAGSTSVKIGSTVVNNNDGNGVVAHSTGAADAFSSSNGSMNVSGDGLSAISNGGNAEADYNVTGTTNVVLNYGGAVGVLASTNGTGNATVKLGNGVNTTEVHSTNTGIATIGAQANAAGSGNASITSFGLVTIDPTEFGYEAVSGTGRALITTGNGDSYTVDDPADVAPEHVGLFAHTGATGDTVAGPSVDIVVAGSNTISVDATNGRFGGVGILGANTGNGTGSVLVDTTGAGGLSITVGGFNSAGIAATTAGTNVTQAVADGPGNDFSDNLLVPAAGSGNVTVNTGAGQITVGPATNPAGSGDAVFSQSYGIFTNTNGGNVSVNNQASITVENFFGSTGVTDFGTGTVGIFGTTNGAGNINIQDSLAGSSIQTQYGDGILAIHTGKGSGAVTVGVSGDITTGTNLSAGLGQGNGVEATTNGSGTVSVTQAASSTITTDGLTNSMPQSAGNAGIFASNTGGVKMFGEVQVSQSGTIVTNASGGFISSKDGAPGTATAHLGGQGVLAITNGNGNVTVTQSTTGSITTLGDSDGIDAANTSQSNGNVTVTAAGLINAGGSGIVAINTSNDDTAVSLLSGANLTAGANGITALQVSGTEGTVTVSTTGTTSIVATGGNGIDAQSNGAGVVTVNNGVKLGGNGGTISAGLDGILAADSFAGNSGGVFVDNEGAITSAGSIGIDAEVSSASNNASVNVRTGDISSISNGVFADAAGTGDVTVNVNATTNGGATLVSSSDANGVVADAELGGNTFVDNEGAVSGAVDGINATAAFNGTVTVLANGNVTGSSGLGSGDGIVAQTNNGLDTVDVGNGAVVQASGSGNGINAETFGIGNVSIGTAAGTAVDGGTGGAGNNGILAQVNSPFSTITIALNGDAGTASPAASWGVNAIGDGGAVEIGQGAASTVTDGGIRAVNITGNGGTATVKLHGVTDNSVREGVLVQTTTGTATVNLGSTGAVNATGTGALASGIEVDTTTGPIQITSAGAVDSDSITNGTAGILAQNTGVGPINIDMTAGSVTGFGGIAAFDQGGDIQITTLGTVTSTGSLVEPPGTLPNTSGGIIANTTGGGIININAVGDVNSSGDFGIDGSNLPGLGSGAITITTGNVSDTGLGGQTFGVLGFSKGSSPISITTNGAIIDSSGAVSSWGVLADSGSGDVIVKTNSTVTGGWGGVGGITGGAATVNVDTTGGLVTASGASGGGNFAEAVLGLSNSGNIVINTGAVIGNGGGGGTIGVDGTSATGNITITNHGAVNATNDGILAITAGNAATIQINVGGTVTGSNGIVTELDALGTTNIVDNNPANTITGTVNDGIIAFNIVGGVHPNGPVNIGAGTGARILADVIGATNGIAVFTDGVTNVFTSGNVTGNAGFGITANEFGVNPGAVTIDVTGGTISGKGTGGANSGGGIEVTTSAGGDTRPITITSNTTIKGSGTGSDGVFVDAAGASNEQLIFSGPLVTGNLDAISMTSNGGSIVIGNLASPLTGEIGDATTLDAAIRTLNTTGPTSIVVGSGATMANDTNATFGINAENTGGGGNASITINNAAQINVQGGGIVAGESSGTNTAGLSIVNTGNISVSGAQGIGVVGGSNFGGLSADIAGINQGTGLVQVNNSGVLDPATFGILMGGGGDVLVTNTGNITATSVGIDAFSTGSGNVTVSNNPGFLTSGGTGINATSNGGPVTVTSSGPITATTGDGIFASSFFGGGTVTVGTSGTPITSNITAGSFGIVAEGSATVNVNVADGVNITAHGADAADIFAESFDFGNTTVNVGNGIKFIEDGAGGSGVVAESDGFSGNVNVNVGTGSIGTASTRIGGDGIAAIIFDPFNSGTATVNNSANIFMASGSDAGIRVTTAGSGTITVNNFGVIDPGAYGIFMSGGGSVFANTTADVTGNIGIHADSFSGTGFNEVSVSVTNGATVTGLTGNGIEAFVTGAGSTDIDVETFDGGNITGATNGIVAQNTGGSSGDVTVDSDTGNASIRVAGLGGDGIDALSNGSGDIEVDAGNTIGQGAAGHVSNGIVAASTGGGDVSVFTGGNVTGDMTGNAGGVGATGITATTKGGNGDVFVDTFEDTDEFVSVTGGNYGIFASAANHGTSTVIVGEFVTAQALGAGAVNAGLGPVGVFASGGDDFELPGAGQSVEVDVEDEGTVFSPNGRAIVTNAGNNAEIDIGFDADVVGLGDATHPVIDVTAVSGATTTIDNAGLISSNHAQPQAYGDFAIRGTTGTVVVNNGGSLFGTVNFSGLTGKNNVTINNGFNGEAGINEFGTSTVGLWQTTGASVLSGGNDVIENGGLDPETGSGTVGVIGTAFNGKATSIDFGAGNDTLINDGSGTILVGQNVIPGAIVSDPGAAPAGAETTPAVLTLSHLETFINNGTIILGSSNAGFLAGGIIEPGDVPGGSDGKIDAVLMAPGTAFSGDGLIDLDANLWSDVQSLANCTTPALTAADCMVVGSTSGNNGIRVTDTGAHALGAFNPTGITIVGGSSGASTFHLDAGSSFFDNKPADAFLFGGVEPVLNKPGLFFYDLEFFSADNTERLVGVPKATAFEFASVGGAAEDLWYTTTQTWFDRTTDLRDTLQGRSDGTEPGVWLKAKGDWTHRTQDVDFSVPGGSSHFVFDTSYDTDAAGLIGGVDLFHVMNKDQALVAGIEAGWFDSDMRFRVSPDRFGFQTTDFGGYATYVAGGLFVDGTINANFFRLNTNLPSLGLIPSPVTSDTRGTTVGGQVEAGYQMPIGGMAFWEPVGSLSYASSTFDDIPIPGGTQKIGDDHSFRGSLGARIGVTSDFTYYKIKLAVTGRVWDEFSNDTLSTLIVPGGPNFLNNDNLKGVFGEISGQANLFSTKSGFSAFLTGGYKFKSNYNEGDVNIGARYQW